MRESELENVIDLMMKSLVGLLSLALIAALASGGSILPVWLFLTSLSIILHTILFSIEIPMEPLVILKTMLKYLRLDLVRVAQIEEIEGEANIFKTLLPPATLIFVVLGSIIAGIATPTEAAGVGAFGALFIAGLNGNRDLGLLRETSYKAATVTTMIKLSAKINRAKPFQSIELRRAKFLRCKYAIVIKEIVRATFPITTHAYALFQASLKFKRAQAFAVPLNTTAIAAHSAISLKRGTAIGRS